MDHQFIHIDPEKSAELSPYKVTIAHGFLTLSLIVHLGGSVPIPKPEALAGVFMGVNYGLDKVRFPAPVPVNSKVRARHRLIAAELKTPNTIQLKREVTIELEGSDKPVCVAERRGIDGTFGRIRIIIFSTRFGQAGTALSV